MKGYNKPVEGSKIVLKKERQVLLVISNAEVCRKLEDSIREKFSYEVEIPKDGKDALDKISREKINMVKSSWK